MKVVEQLIDHCRANDLLTDEQVASLMRMGFLSGENPDAHYNEWWGCADCGREWCDGGCLGPWCGLCGQQCWEVEGNRPCRPLDPYEESAANLDECQEGLAGVHDRAGKALWRVGRSRRRWWYGYQVSQVARARRMRRRR